jgi:hypothetical protein
MRVINIDVCDEDPPSFGGTVLPSHQNTAVFTDGLCTIHGSEKRRAYGNIRRRQRVCFIVRECKTREEKGDDRLTRLYFLSTRFKCEQGQQLAKGNRPHRSSRRLPARSSKDLQASFVD